MMQMEYLLNEYAYLLAVLPAYFWWVTAVSYVLIGAVLWSRFIYKWEAEEGLEDPLLFAERIGTRTTGETVALLIVKGAFYLLWPVFLAIMAVSYIVGLLRPRPVTTTS